MSNAPSAVRRFLVIAAALTAVVLCGILGVRLLLATASRAAERHLTRLAAERGFEISKTSWRRMGFRWPASIRWEGLSLEARGGGRDTPLPQEPLLIAADSVTAALERFDTRMVSIAVDGLLLTSGEGGPPVGDQSSPRIETVAGRTLVIRAPIDFLRPRSAAAQFRQISEELGRLARTGTSALPVSFEGTVTFRFRGTATAGIRVRREGAESVLTMDEGDLLALSGRMSLRLPLTQSEVALLARYPIRVPRLLAIRDQVRTLADEEQRREAHFPDDAYCHLLWSHLLTTNFGEQFAAEVTDAHERGITGNTESERRMDLSNNALGRWLARIGVPREALADRARSDSRVIRNPQEIGHKRQFDDE